MAAPNTSFDRSAGTLFFNLYLLSKLRGIAAPGQLQRSTSSCSEHSMARTLLIVALLSLLLLALADRSRASSEPQKIDLAGIVIAYDRFSDLDNISGTVVLQSAKLVLVVRLNDRAAKRVQSRYIKVVDSLRGEYPTELTRRMKRWRFHLTPDSACNTRIEKGDPGLPIWKLIPGAEKQKIPFGQTLPCYRLETGAYEAFR